MKRAICLLLTLWAAWPTQAQRNGDWVSHLAYSDAGACVVAPDRVFASYAGNLLSYRPDDGEVRTFSKVEGLSDRNIRCMAYAAATRQLVMVYENGNIDLMDTESDEVYNLPQLKNSQITSLQVNGLDVVGSEAYIGLGDGLAVVDLKNRLLRDYYTLGRNVTAATRNGKYIYAATANGVYYAEATTNLHDRNYWHNMLAGQQVAQIVHFGGYVFLRGAGQSLARIAPDNTYEKLSDEGVDFFNVSSRGLMAGGAGKWQWFASPTAAPTTWRQNTTGVATVAAAGSQTFWAAAGTRGLQKFVLHAGADTLTAEDRGLTVDGPARDMCYYMRTDGGRVLIGGGFVDYSGARHPGAVMEYDGTSWESVDNNSVERATGLSFLDVTSVACDPRDPSRLFASSGAYGIYEFRNFGFEKLYTLSNSNLHSAAGTDPYYVRTDALNFDGEGNLWMVNNETDSVIHVLRTDGRWKAFYHRDFANIPTAEKSFFDSYGRFWVTSRRAAAGKQAGVLCFDYGGTIDDEDDDHWRFRSSGVNQDGTSVTLGDVYALTPDRTGAFWVGTASGVYVISDPGAWFDSNFYFTQPKIPRNDGSGLADYLLSGTAVSAIATDAQNRKWIGTPSGGVYLISADGSEELAHFTAENSPLFSNNIYSIAVRDETGEVLFGTDRGIVGYMSGVTAEEHKLNRQSLHVYPNPVRPDYQGLIRISGLAPGADVKIISPAGQVVSAGRVALNTYEWDGCDRRGRRVKSGVYYVLTANAEGKNAVAATITVVR